MLIILHFCLLFRFASMAYKFVRNTSATNLVDEFPLSSDMLHRVTFFPFIIFPHTAWQPGFVVTDYVSAQWPVDAYGESERVSRRRKIKFIQQFSTPK